MDPLKQYFDKEIELASSLDLNRVRDTIEMLERARMASRRVFVFGNGGSAATAAHFACDLGKGTNQPKLPRFKVLCLSDNVPALMAYANDMGFEYVFSEPLLTHSEPGDVAVAISASGNSPNVVRAVETARSRGLGTVGLTGFDGGKIKSMVDVNLHVPSQSFGHVEDLHLAVCHAICEMLKLKHE